MPADDIVLDLFAHDSWANLRLLEFCTGLNPEQLAATDAAIYGNVVSTMQHLVGGEAYYWSLFGRSLPEWSRPDSDPATLAEVTLWAHDMNAFWQQLLCGPYPSVVHRKRNDGTISEMPAGTVLVQAIHHGNVHREQVSHVLTALGLEPPDISGWRFGRDAGRFAPRGTQ